MQQTALGRDWDLDSVPSSTLGTSLLRPQFLRPCSGVSAGDCKLSTSEVRVARQRRPQRSHRLKAACVCTRVHSHPLPWLPSGREEGIFGALGSTVVGLITGFQPWAGGHALGRRGSSSEPCHFPTSAGLFKGGHPDIFSTSRRVDCRGPSMNIMMHFAASWE